MTTKRRREEIRKAKNHNRIVEYTERWSGPDLYHGLMTDPEIEISDHEAVDLASGVTKVRPVHVPQTRAEARAYSREARRSHREITVAMWKSDLAHLGRWLAKRSRGVAIFLVCVVTVVLLVILGNQAPAQTTPAPVERVNLVSAGDQIFEAEITSIDIDYDIWCSLTPEARPDLVREHVTFPDVKSEALRYGVDESVVTEQLHSFVVRDINEECERR